MKRTNISVKTEATRTTLEFDEEYQAGKTINTISHFREEFTKNENELTYHLVISELSAPGFMGFFYGKFGSSSIAKSILGSYKTYLEQEVLFQLFTLGLRLTSF